MRIHVSASVGYEDLIHAARLAQAAIDTLTVHGSRSRDHAYEVKLRGNSRRRPNFYNGDGSFAATWDQWGVFLGYLFSLDHDMLIGSGTGAEDQTRFHHRTNLRFTDPENFEHPLDHDHVFRYAGTPRQQECTRCHAITRWDY